MESEVIRIIKEYQMDEGLNIGLETHLINDLSLSSFDVVELVCSFEEELDIEIQDEKIKNFRYVKDIVNYISDNQ